MSADVGTCSSRRCAPPDDRTRTQTCSPDERNMPCSDHGHPSRNAEPELCPPVQVLVARFALVCLCVWRGEWMVVQLRQAASTSAIFSSGQVWNCCRTASSKPPFEIAPASKHHLTMTAANGVRCDLLAKHVWYER